MTRRAPPEGLRVLHLTRDVAEPHAVNMLADYGPDVLNVEPPDGDRDAHVGPFPGDKPHPGRSGLFLHLNTNEPLEPPPRSERGGLRATGCAS